MKILRTALSSYPRAGGKEFHIYEVSRRQAERGHSVELWIRFGSADLAGVVVHRTALPPLDLPRGALVAAGLFMTEVAARLQARPARADVVHAHGDLAEAWFGVRLARRLDVPLVLTVHAGVGTRYRRARSRAFARVDRFVALGGRVADDVVACGVPRDRVTISSSGVDVQAIDAGERPAAFAYRVITVGALQPMKGHDVTIDACKLLEARGVPLSLVVVGDGPLRGRLERRAAGLRHVAFLGNVPKERVYEALRSSDLFVLASRELAAKSEGIPTAVLEAMAAGLPVVVTSAAGGGEVVLDGRTGSVVEPDRPDLVAASIQVLFDDRELRDRLGNAARHEGRRRTWDRVVDELDEVYADVLAQSKHSPR